ncbi:hypothetical protein [Salibacterium sp. K-3]
MTVQELIIELLDCEMDADLSVLAQSKEEEMEEDEIYVVEDGSLGKEYVEIQVSTEKVIVDEDDYDEMKEQIEGLEED